MSRALRAALRIGVALAACAILALVDSVEPPYAVKSAIKLVCFVAVPALFLGFGKDERFRALLRPKKKLILPAFGLGLAVYGFLLGGYFLAVKLWHADFSGVVAALAGEAVTRETFPYVAAYITLVNSFCEEFFFRGFAFGSLCGVLPRAAAYPFSALLFAVYHVAILSGWFSPLLVALMISGLAIAGLFFDWLDEKSGSVYPSWIVHAFANLGINTIGLILFGIL